jgi:predicted RNA-binding Zn-ribbon protein involved in translation (DUF1610 family)
MTDSAFQYDCPECGNESPTMTKRARETWLTDTGDPHPWNDKQVFRCDDCGERWVV